MVNKPKPLKPSEVLSQRKWQDEGLAEAKSVTATKYKDPAEVSSGNFERIGPFVFYGILRITTFVMRSDKMYSTCQQGK